METPGPVGYIGLGMMGSAMATHLAGTGTPVVVHDRNPDATTAAAEAGATVVASAAEVGERCSVVSICVPAAHHIDAVLTGPNGIADTGRAGQVLLVHSTVSPGTIHAAAEVARQWGGVVHDACVAGGPHSAADGDLVILAGGVDDLPDGVRDLLGVYGSTVIDAGPVGSGAALKVAINIMTYAQFAASAAAFDVARATGTRTDAIVEAWRHTGQLGQLTEAFLPLLAIPTEHITGEFRDSLANTVDIAVKDLDLAGGLVTSDGMRHVVDSVAAAMPHVFGLEP